MKKHSKRFREARKLIDPKKSYSAREALELAQKTANVKFDAGIEMHMRLGIDPKKADQIVRGSVSLPHGTGKKKRIAVFADAAGQEKAKKAGAEVVGGEELIKEIKTTGKCNFDIALATPAMMKHLGQIAKILGPKGLMPNPRNETVTSDIEKSIVALQGGKVAFRNDETGNIHQLIGKASFDIKKLQENFESFLEAIRRARPHGVKGAYLKTVSVCSTMGPSVRVAV
ncbi:MAG: 50S ribosomal protein L1 [Patescibacteria group bacterium]|nr:50S ribosomal protein L1 [Patescibacteria group bacterium]MDD5716094.1 50S ribosomal protein L1 [Patescibacteria group bacterium]